MPAYKIFMLNLIPVFTIVTMPKSFLGHYSFLLLNKMYEVWFENGGFYVAGGYLGL
jgi:hypothetical protein